MADELSRTTVIERAIKRQLEERRAGIDRATDLGEITITVKLQAGTTTLRGLVWEEERTCRLRTGA